MNSPQSGKAPAFTSKVREGVYQYRHPDYVKETGKRLTIDLKKSGLSFKDFENLISELNEKYISKKPEKKSSKISKKMMPVPANIEAAKSLSQIARLEFEEWSYGKHKSAATMPRERTRLDTEKRYEKVAAYFGNLPMHEIRAPQLHEFMLSINSPHEAAKYLVILRRLFAFARKVGAFPANEANPPDDLTRAPIPPTSRMPLTQEQYDAIYSIAPAWVQVAMDIAMETSLRISDVLALKFSDIKDGFLTVYPSKSQKNLRSKFMHNEKRLDFDLSKQPALAAAIERGRAIVEELNSKGVLYRGSPFIVSYAEKLRQVPSKRKEHPMQVTKEIATHTFKKLKNKVRATSSVFDGYDDSEMGGFHGIRKLSLDKIEREHGIEAARVRAGHTSTRMTAHYVMAVDKRNVVSF